MMSIAILAVAFFQAYWLLNTYHDEEETLNIRTNILFREAIFESQASRFTLDTAGSINMRSRVDAIRVIDNVKNQVRNIDTGKAGTKRIMLRFKGDRADSNHGNTRPRRGFFPQKDSVLDIHLDNFSKRRRFNMSGKGDIVYEVLEGVDLVQDSLTIPDISGRLKAALKKENIDILFNIERTELKNTVSQRMESLEVNERLESSNEVIVGFTRPVRFALKLENRRAYLMKHISSQIIVSVLLVALTAISFLVIFRNLIRQRKLTQLKNDFISNITHELKTPIATVSVAVEALKNFNALEDPKRTQEYLDISANELQRLSLLVDKVLKLSMFEKQEIELKIENLDLKQLVEEVVGSMRLQFDKYHASVNIQLPVTPLMITADRLHITSVIYNLLDNAIKYSISKPVIRVAVEERNEEMQLVVEDNGPGIAAEYKDRVFDKFFRVPTGDHHNVKGYGLGLSYVAYVIARHHGTIRLQSESGTGSTFTVTLPK